LPVLLQTVAYVLSPLLKGGRKEERERKTARRHATAGLMALACSKASDGVCVRAR
jgi:hypothetical protein